MTDILVKYAGFPALEIVLDKNSFVDAYKELVRRNTQAPAISRDPCKYTPDYLVKLAQQAKKMLGWNWIVDSYDLETTTRLHKDIETYLAKGFADIPEEHDNLCHELHYAIHAIQAGNTRGSWIQVEWFNDDSIPMSDALSFCTDLEFGDIKLQNPYVGHDPAFLFMQKDFANIGQTCRFHDLVRPGINIMIKSYKFNVTDSYLETFKTHAPEWFEIHGSKKILRYTGWPRVGRVKNLDTLQQIAESAVFELEKIEVA